MRKSERNKKARKPGKGAPARPKELTDLTEQDLKQVQGGRDVQTGLPSGKRVHNTL